MKRLILFLVIAAAVLVGVSQTVASDVTSTFDSDSDGWQVRSVTIQANLYSNPLSIHGTYAVNWESSGGLPGGHVSTWQPDFDTDFFLAPSQFLGDKSAVYGGALSFDLQDTTTSLPWAGNNPPYNLDPLLILTGGGHTLFYQDSTIPEFVTWNHFDIALAAGPHWLYDSDLTVGDQGPAPTSAQFNSVLSSLEGLYIMADWRGPGSDLCEMDNVVMTTAPEPSTVVLLGVGAISLLGYAWRRRKRAA